MVCFSTPPPGLYTVPIAIVLPVPAIVLTPIPILSSPVVLFSLPTATLRSPLVTLEKPPTKEPALLTLFLRPITLAWFALVAIVLLEPTAVDSSPSTSLLTPSATATFCLALFV